MAKRKIVTLCGSTRFRDAYEKAMRDETLKGHIVLTVGMFGHQEGIDMDGPIKVMLDELHFDKIDLSSEILVLNCLRDYCPVCDKFCALAGPMDRSACCDGPVTKMPYIGYSTNREIMHAKSLGKVIRYLNPPG